MSWVSVLQIPQSVVHLSYKARIKEKDMNEQIETHSFRTGDNALGRRDWYISKGVEVSPVGYDPRNQLHSFKTYWTAESLEVIETEYMISCMTHHENTPECNREHYTIGYCIINKVSGERDEGVPPQISDMWDTREEADKALTRWS